MVTTVLFLAAIGAELVLLGRTVRLSREASLALPKAEPRFAWDLLAGAAVLRQLSEANSHRFDRYLRELHEPWRAAVLGR